MAAAEPARAGSPRISRERQRSEPQSLQRLIGTVEARAVWILGVLVLLDLVVLMHMGRGLTFFYDEWDFVQHDYGGGWHIVLASHVGNIVFFPALVYKVLFHLAGLDHYWVFRLTDVLLQLISGCLVYVLAARRTSRVVALLAATLVLFAGAAWEDMLWAFQIGYLLSIASGLATWIMLDRRDRLGDLAATACLVVSVGSSSLGLALAVGLAVELAWQRDWRRLWVIAVSAVLYAIWYLGYGESQATSEGLIHAPGFAAELAAAATGAVAGLDLDWGRPLLLLGAVVLVMRLARGLPVSPRLAGLVAAAIALWVLTAVARSTISPPDTSRYMLLGVVLIVLIGVELVRGETPAPWSVVVATVFVLYAVTGGLSSLHVGRQFLAPISDVLAAELGALEVDAVHAPPNFHPDTTRAPTLEAGTYLHTVRAIGSSPADTPTEIAAADPSAREAADKVLVALAPPTVARARRAATGGGAPPPVAAFTGVNEHVVGSCVVAEPVSGGGLSLELRVSPGAGLLVRSGREAPTAVDVRRFASAGSVQPVGTIPAGGQGSVTLALDRATAWPWYVDVAGSAPVRVCSR